MLIYHLAIKNFRGIRVLNWHLNGRVLCLIGPNDSTKTTILDAIEFVLLPRYSATITDADFYNGDPTIPIVIEATVGDLPLELIVEPEKFGLCLRGYDKTKGILEDPVDGAERVLTVRFEIGKDLEPAWTVVKQGIPAPKRIGWQDRERLGVSRLGNDVERHLTWARGSALTKLTAKNTTAAQTFAKVTREAKKIVAESPMACTTGRQLVLTHTHAGVKAICERMVELRVPPSQYHVCTLDSFALRYAAAFPTVSGWTVPEPEGDQWAELLPAAVSALKLNAVEEVLRASYTGIFVDEYQDCSTIQHELVLRLACVLPCRVLGDPLQAVFAELNKANALPWAEVVKTFPLLHQLNYPHRWQKKNEALGRWLLDIHPALIKGEPIDVSRVSCVKFVESKPGVQIGQCKGLLRYKQESIVALRKMRPLCHSLAGDLKNLFTVFEDANGEDILKAARTLDDAIGVQRVGALHGLAKRWLTCLPTQAIAPLVADVIAGKPIKVRRPDLIVLGQTLERVRDQNDFRPVADAFDAYAVLKKTPTFMSKELWRGITAAARHAAGTIGLTLHDAVWRQRDMHRQNGRHPPRHCLSTPLLVKGLQFDHGVILDAADFPGTEALYVSMTRSSKSLTIVAASPLLSTTRVAP